MSLSLLFPRPQQFTLTQSTFLLPDEPGIRLAYDPQRIRFAAQRLQHTLSERGLYPRMTAADFSDNRRTGVWDSPIILDVNPILLGRPQSYRLVINERGISVTGADEAGLFYGVCTLQQILGLVARKNAGGPPALPGLQIVDWPDLAHRGVMLDISRDRVPTMDTLYELVDMLAGWKINQLQLYTEHTFAYQGHEVV
jgi:hexosaminidase